MLPAALLWGSGTAIGEIPPYAFSYHAAKAGIRNEEWDNMFKVKPVSEGQGFFEALLNRMKNWMLGFIQRCAPLPRLLIGGCSVCAIWCSADRRSHTNAYHTAVLFVVLSDDGSPSFLEDLLDLFVGWIVL